MQNVNRVEELPSNTVSATKKIRYKDISAEIGRASCRERV